MAENIRLNFALPIAICAFTSMLMMGCFGSDSTRSDDEAFFEPVASLPPLPAVSERSQTDSILLAVADSLLARMKAQERRIDELTRLLQSAQAPPIKETPLISETPQIRETPPIRETSPKRETPTIKETPTIREAPTVGVAPATKDDLASKEPSTGKEVPTIKEAPPKAPPLSTPVQVPPPSVTTPTEPVPTYDEALAIYNQKRYRTALAAFRKVLGAGLQKDLEHKCYFWIGGGHYHLKEYRQAIPQFEKVLTFSESNIRDDAYYMLGQTYEQLDDLKKAREMFETIVNEFPQSSLFRSAQNRVSELSR